MKTDDYRAKMKADDKARLEKTALAILSTSRLASREQKEKREEYITRVVAASIEAAKEFIKQIDEEFKNESV